MNYGNYASAKYKIYLELDYNSCKHWIMKQESTFIALSGGSISSFIY